MSNKYKLAAQQQWNANPCGISIDAALLDDGQFTRSIFDSIAVARYQSNPWLEAALPWDAVAGQYVLEIGFGVGTDLVRMAQNGANANGIDLTERHHRLAQKNFEQHGLISNLISGDAAVLPFDDGVFDLVYSVGVLHHTPDIEEILAEVYRVTRPGGKVIIVLYHRWSVFHLFYKIFVDGILRGNLFKLGYSGLMATIEQGCDGRTNIPLVRTYGGQQLRRIMRAFSGIDIQIAHLDPGQTALPSIGPVLSEATCNALASRFGWYIIATAHKPKRSAEAF